MWWLVILVVIVGVFILARGYTTVRKSLKKYGPGQHESWDARMIERLRSHGYAPFNEYRVDFFLALPDEAACQAVRARLEPEGFAVDVTGSREGLVIHGEALPGDVSLPLSLHASKTMRLIVPDMQDLSRRMAEMAEEFRGRYDGWAA
jgi:hypothetical protein